MKLIGMLVTNTKTLYRSITRNFILALQFIRAYFHTNSTEIEKICLFCKTFHVPKISKIRCNLKFFKSNFKSINYWSRNTCYFY